MVTVGSRKMAVEANQDKVEKDTFNKSKKSGAEEWRNVTEYMDKATDTDLRLERKKEEWIPVSKKGL